MGSMTLTRSSADISGMDAAGGGEISFSTSAGPVSMKITSDLQTVASEWREIETAVTCTSAQTFDWARAWSVHMLAAQGRAPVIAVGYDADGQVQFLLPFEPRRSAG